MQYNKLYNDEKHYFIHDDVIEWLGAVPAGSFDLIICDPPTFSNSKRMEDNFDIQRDHVALIKKLLKACDEGGRIYFSNNYKGFVLDKESIPTHSIKDITGATTPFDFQGKLHRSCFLIDK